MPVSENRIRLDSVFPSLSPEKHYICEVNDKPHINMEHNILIPLLLTLGADIYTVSKILGHRSVRATQVYAKIVDKKKDDAIALVDDAF